MRAFFSAIISYNKSIDSEMMDLKIVCLLADGFEDIEALGTVAILRRGGILVDLVSVFNTPKVVGAFKITVIPDKMMNEITDKEYDGVFIPGGGAVKIMQGSPAVLKLIMAFAAKKKLLAAICAGPILLGTLGLLDGIRYTSFPSTETFIPKGIRIASPSVIADNIITGAGAGCVFEFAYDVITVALGKEKAEEVKKRMLYHVYE
jgi:DJ-1 family protein